MVGILVAGCGSDPETPDAAAGRISASDPGREVFVDGAADPNEHVVTDIDAGAEPRSRLRIDAAEGGGSLRSESMDMRIAFTGFTQAGVTFGTADLESDGTVTWHVPSAACMAGFERTLSIDATVSDGRNLMPSRVTVTSSQDSRLITAR